MKAVQLLDMTQPLLIVKHTLSLATAKQIGQAAEQWAFEAGLNVVIAILDDGGTPLYLARMDGAPLGSVKVAQHKAHSSVIFKCATKDFQTGLASGGTGLLSLDIVPFEGGVPLIVNEKIVGAIGVSGATAAQDESVAQAGVKALATLLQNEATAQ